MINQKLFCYGTLQDPAVFLRITGKTACYQTATLDGFVRYRVSGADYPGVISSGHPNTPLEGLLVSRLGRQELKLLDAFEGELYERVLVPVESEGRRHDAWLYVIKKRYKNRLSNDAWEFELYRERFLKRLLR